MATDLAASPGRKWLPELDGIRAFCILGVIGAHMADNQFWHWLGSAHGVDIFFILSGYLITMLALREERAAGAVSLKAFYVRRTFRIFPLFYLVLLLNCGLIYCTNWGSRSRADFTAALPYLATYLPEVPHTYEAVAHGRAIPFGYSWSLGIEEKYYLVWPFLAFLLWARRPLLRRGWAIVLMLLFTATQSVGRLDPRVAEWRIEFLLFPYSQILLGSLLALLLEDEVWYGRLRKLGTPLGTATTVTVFVAAQLALTPLSHSFREVVILYGLAGTALLASVLTGAGWLQRLLRFKVAGFIGRISYGMYLCHGFGISAAQKAIKSGSGRIELSILAYVLAVLLTVVVAYALAIFVERPLTRFGHRWSDRIRGRARSSEPTNALTGNELQPRNPIVIPQS
jgi:peptidoglycan/LPS O-acetylase OafA/YrhL